MAFVTEDFANWNDTVASGGYTAGSGQLNIGNTANAPPNNLSRCYIADQSTKAVKVILKITAINSGTQFAVTAEGTDANANSGDLVFSCLTVGAENQLIADGSRIMSGSLPGTYDRKKGNKLFPTDDAVAWVSNGTSWNAWGPRWALTPIIAANYSFSHNTVATANSTNGVTTIYATQVGADNLQTWDKAVPTSTPYSVVVLVTLGIFKQAQAGGLLLRESSSGHLVEYGVLWISNIPSIAVAHYTSYTGGGSVTSNLDPYLSNVGYPVWLKIRNDGTDLYYSISYDNLVFYQWYKEALTVPFTTGPSHWGLTVNPNSGSGTPPVAITCYSWAEGT